MSPFDDDQDMSAREDDVLSGRPVESEPELVAFVAALRATADEPAGRPNLALAALLRDGLPPAATGSRVRSPRSRRPAVRNPLRALAGLGLGAKILLGAGIAAASVTGAATIDAVPDAVQGPASAIVSGVVHLFAPGAVQPARPAPHPTAPRTAGPAGLDTGSGAEPPAPTALPTAVVAPPPVAVPAPARSAAPMSVPTLAPGAVLPTVPDIRGLLASPGSGATVTIPGLPPVVVPPVPGQ